MSTIRLVYEKSDGTWCLALMDPKTTPDIAKALGELPHFNGKLDYPHHQHLKSVRQAIDRAGLAIQSETRDGGEDSIEIVIRVVLKPQAESRSSIPDPNRVVLTIQNSTT